MAPDNNFNLLKSSTKELRTGRVDVDRVEQSLITTIVDINHGGISLQTVNEIAQKMESQLPPDWYDKWKRDDQAGMWEKASVQLLENSGRYMRTPGLDDLKRKELLAKVSWIMVGRKVLGEESGQKRQQKIQVPEYSSEEPLIIEGQFTEVVDKPKVGEALPSGEQIYDKLLPLVKTSSGGKDCVPRVVTWMLALTRDSDKMRAESDVNNDVASLRKNGGDGYYVSRDGTQWVAGLRYLRRVFTDGVFNIQDKRDLVSINEYNSIGKARTNEDMIDKLSNIAQSVFEKGEFQMENLDKHPSFLKDGVKPERFMFKGKPVFAMKSESRMMTRVVRNNPTGEFFTNPKFDNVGECPRIGGQWNLIGQHEVLLVDYGENGYQIVDPQSGMLLEIDKYEFERRVRSNQVVFDHGVCI